MTEQEMAEFELLKARLAQSEAKVAELEARISVCDTGGEDLMQSPKKMRKADFELANITTQDFESDRHDTRVVPQIQIYASGKKVVKYLADKPNLTVAELFEINLDSAGMTAKVREGIEGLRAAYLDGTLWNVAVPLSGSLPEYVARALSALHAGSRIPANQAEVLLTRMGLGNNLEEMTLDDAAKQIGQLSRERVRQIEDDIMGSLFNQEFSDLFALFREAVEKLFQSSGFFLGKDELCKGLDEMCGWSGTSWLSAYNLIRYLAPDDISFDSVNAFAWQFEKRSTASYDALKKLLGAVGVPYSMFEASSAKDKMAALGFTISDAAYEFMAHRIVDEQFVGEDRNLPCYMTMARKFGICASDVGAVSRVLKSVFDAGNHLYTMEELLRECRRSEPGINWTQGKIVAAIDRRELCGSCVLRYERGRRNGGATTFTLDTYISDKDRNAAKEAVDVVAAYLETSRYPVVSIFKTYNEFRGRLTIGFPQLCFYELVRMYGDGKINCQEYPRIAALSVPYGVNAYGEAAKSEFRRQGFGTVTTKQLREFLVNSLHEDPALVAGTMATIGLRRVSDEHGADYVVD